MPLGAIPYKASNAKATLNTAQLFCLVIYKRIGQSSTTSSLGESINILNVISSLIVSTSINGLRFASTKKTQIKTST